jgi:WhiB family transcriptional regulator, redox-sensing transcriptional regulator
MERAACRDVAAGLFYRVARETRDARRTRESVAVAVCASCPVRADCLAHALRTHEQLGIWGGLTETQRRTYD